MRIFLPVFAVVAALCVRARAEPMVATSTPVAATSAPGAVASAPVEEGTPPRLALALNAPLGWAISSFGLSAYVRLGDRIALRGNVASYRNTAWGEVVAGLSGDGGTGYGGRVTDVGIGAVYYPVRVWDGLLFEVGVLRRARDVYVWPEFEPKVTTESTELAGRLLIGWSWRIKQRGFVAIAAGLSIGRETGEEITTPDDGRTFMSRQVNRGLTDAEGYIRIGMLFGE